ncbi:hypothetical protein ACRAWD_22190 [Caulobacter segnis]
MQALGLGLGTYIHELGQSKIVVGHDFRSYSSSIKNALILGLISAGCEVHDIGLALVADRLFRPVRPRHPLRGHGHRQPQRERLDRGEDGRSEAADLRSRRDEPSEGHRAGRPVRPERDGGKLIRVEGHRPSATSTMWPSAPASPAR